MKLIFDQNISHKILKNIPTYFEGSTTVKSEELINASDKVIWDFAKKNEYTIVTQDSDFDDLSSVNGFPPKVIWIRIGNVSTESVRKVLANYFKEIETFIHDNEHGCLEIVSIYK